MFSIQIEQLPKFGHVVKFCRSYKLHYATFQEGDMILYV